MHACGSKFVSGSSRKATVAESVIDPGLTTLTVDIFYSMIAQLMNLHPII